jgi:UDP-2-acetamido-3-amino-2,3-dideoxy-glucuronate N-acetyltransferase
MDFMKHESAIVDEGALIGKNTKIWHWTHLSANAQIGENCSLGQNVYVGNNVIIGNNCKIQNNVAVYDNVVLENDVFCGPSMVFTNVINPRAEISRRSEYKKTLVKKGVTIGANATIICGITLGEYSFIAAGAVVTKDVKPFALMVGVPARHVGWMSRYGEKIPLSLEGDGNWKCLNTNTNYVMQNGFIVDPFC